MSTTPAPTTITLPGLADIHTYRGASAPDGAPTDLLIEIPHGATRTEDFQALAPLLDSPLPDGLVDFFHVNTDSGAPELATALVLATLAVAPHLTAVIVRSRIPRTLIDCNRRIDATAEEFRAAGVAPGIMPWIVTAHDRTLLLARHSAYVAAVEAEANRLAPDGQMVLLHTYAPRTVGVNVDMHIVPNLHHAYEPDIFETWPMRPPVDIIARAPDGSRAISDAHFDALRRHFAPLGITPTDSHTYHLHDATLGYAWVQRFPGRVLCPEVRRDLLVDTFEPFAQAAISDARVAPIAHAFAAALLDTRKHTDV